MQMSVGARSRGLRTKEGGEPSLGSWRSGRLSSVRCECSESHVGGRWGLEP